MAATDGPAGDSETLGLEAAEWLLSRSRPHEGGLAWSAGTASREPAADLYSGTAGVVMALLEAHGHDGDQRWADASVGGARALASMVEAVADSSLYAGATGVAVGLGAVGEVLGDVEATRASARLLRRVRQDFDGERWGDAFDLLAGNAGIALGALALGDPELAELAVTPYLRTAEETTNGVTWENRRGQPARRHHISHGTLGVCHALVATGAALGRPDLHMLGLAGVADVVARDEAGPEGFLVPHSDPQQVHDRIERFSYGWCHGPAGDAQVFRLLGSVTAEPVWASLEDRCWQSLTTSGLPRRTRPGFWDNSGRCCGTAGVLALACDRAVERDVRMGEVGGGALEFAGVLVDDLADRAVRDRAGARWRNVEHRDPSPVLPARYGWAMGNAGIVRELLRHARIAQGRDSAYAVDWPDHPPVRSAGVGRVL